MANTGTESMSEEGRQCAHSPCSCVVTGSSGVRDGDQLYCSRGCAGGAGCDHESCHCVDGERATG